MKLNFLFPFTFVLLGNSLLAGGHSNIEFPVPSTWFAEGIVSSMNSDGTFTLDGLDEILKIRGVVFLETFVPEELIGRHLICLSDNRWVERIASDNGPISMVATCQFLGVPGNPIVANHYEALGQAHFVCELPKRLCAD